MVEENFEGEYFVFTSLHADGFSAIAARQDVVLAARGVHASGPCTPITPPLKGVHAVDLPLQGRPFQTGFEDLRCTFSISSRFVFSYVDSKPTRHTQDEI